MRLSPLSLNKEVKLATQEDTSSMFPKHIQRRRGIRHVGTKSSEERARVPLEWYAGYCWTVHLNWQWTFFKSVRLLLFLSACNRNSIYLPLSLYAILRESLASRTIAVESKVYTSKSHAARLDGCLVELRRSHWQWDFPNPPKASAHQTFMMVWVL